MTRAPHGNTVLAVAGYSLLSISRASKALTRVLAPPFQPQWDISLYRPLAKWKSFWSALKPLRSRLADEVQTLHLLALGRLHSPRAWSAPVRPIDPRWPHNALQLCALCLQDVPECNTHIYLQCSVAIALWQYLDTPTPRPRDFASLFYIDYPYCLDVAFAAAFVHMLYRLLRARRLSCEPLSPVDHVKLARDATSIHVRLLSIEQQIMG